MTHHKAVLLLVALGYMAGGGKLAAAGDSAAVRSASRTFTLRAMVSESGKALTDVGDGKLWTVANPDALRGYEGQLVSAQIEPGTSANQVRIRSLHHAQAEISHVHLGDAAFRR